MWSRGVIISSASFCLALTLTNAESASVSIIPLQDRVSELEKKTEKLEHEILIRNILLSITALTGLIGAGTGIRSFSIALKNRNFDNKVRAFETNYEGRLQSALERVEAHVADLRFAAEKPNPSERIKEVGKVWIGPLVHALGVLNEQLTELNESNNVGRDDWSSAIDDYQDQIGESINILMDETIRNSEVVQAADLFAMSARKISESIRTKLIEHKKTLS